MLKVQVMMIINNYTDEGKNMHVTGAPTYGNNEVSSEGPPSVNPNK